MYLIYNVHWYMNQPNSREVSSALHADLPMLAAASGKHPTKDFLEYTCFAINPP